MTLEDDLVRFATLLILGDPLAKDDGPLDRQDDVTLLDSALDYRLFGAVPQYGIFGDLEYDR
jgi:hypothetical protein